jgi:hypothetical protein
MTDTLLPPKQRLTPKPSSPRPKVRMSWLLVATGLFLFVILLVLWAVSNASERTEVLVVIEPVAAGELIPDSAIGTTAISAEEGFGRIYVASQRDALVDAVALTDLVPGDLLGPSSVTGEPETLLGEQLVGVVLRSGRYPTEMQRDDVGVAVSTLDRESVEPASVPVRIVSVSISETLEASVTMAVATEDAPLVGTWAGQDEMVLVITPFGAEQ